MTDLLLDPIVTAEIDAAHQSSDVSDLPWTPSDDDEARVDRYLRAHRHYTEKLAQDTARADEKADAEIARIEAWREAETRDARNALAFLNYQLQSFSEAVGRAKRTSPDGKLSWRKGSKSIVVADPEAFVTRHAGTDLVRTLPTPAPVPDKQSIRNHIKATGEIPEGAEDHRAADKFVIDTGGKK